MTNITRGGALIAMAGACLCFALPAASPGIVFLTAIMAALNENRAQEFRANLAMKEAGVTRDEIRRVLGAAFNKRGRP